MAMARTPPLPTSGTNEANFICTICNENLLENQECMYIAQCHHSFHRNCIEKYLASTSECPTCKRPFELSELRSMNPQNEPLQLLQNESYEVQNTSQEFQRQKSNSYRGKKRGALAKQYNTRSSARNAQFNSNQLLLPDIYENSTMPAEDNTIGEPSSNRSHVPSFNPRTPQRTDVTHNSNNIDYDIINRMIESGISKLLRNMNLNNCVSNTNNNHPTSTDQPHTSRSSTPNFNSSLSSDKIPSIIRNWNLQFDGSTQGLDVDEFLYRVKSLAADNFEGDYTVICKNLNILLSGKAREWFWRYRKQVPSVIWEDFCIAIRYQYKDFRSDADIREELRNRKQKPGESFESFYDSICTILDRLSSQIPDVELIEIIKRNLRPDIRHELLYVPILSIAHLRKLIQMRENLLNDETCRRHLSNKSTNNSYPKRYVSEVEHFENFIDNLDPEKTSVSVDAVAHGPHNVKCWNCQEPGHFWEDCLKDRSVFCYGCGARNIYKPNCLKCTTKKLHGTYNQNLCNASKNP